MQLQSNSLANLLGGAALLIDPIRPVLSKQHHDPIPREVKASRWNI